jgi:RNA polymerase sigma factor (sigma-70 family)
VTEAATQRAVEAVWRIESARVIGALARMVRDVSLAEDLAQDALVAALEKWPRSGVPDNPGAWLMATAKHRAIDLMRRAKVLESKQADLALLMTVSKPAPAFGDDVLALMFATCHPVLSAEARVALTLRMLGGLTTPAIARAFLVPETTIAQRITRAKRALAAEHVPFEIPEDIAPRLGSVLEVIYLIFNEGYAASAGDDWMRPALCEDALRLGRILATLAPAHGEVHGLVALMELQASRTKARTDKDGNPILLADQDRRRWDPLLIGRGVKALERAKQLGLGPYGLQAAIAAEHVRPETNWIRIAALYETLARIQPSPVVELNRAVAIGMAFGPELGLRHLEGLELPGYHLLPSVRADLLAKLGRTAEARGELEQAAALANNARERDLLLERARILDG